MSQLSLLLFFFLKRDSICYRFISRRHFEYMEMDTDSAYMGLSTADIPSAVRPEMRDEFYDRYGEWFPRPYCTLHQASFKQTCMRGEKWEGHDCCLSQLRYDSRTPGLFKVEFEGDGMVALNAKTYTCWKQCGKQKLSSKGISKRTNVLSKDDYLNVLKSGKSQVGTNRGFVKRGNNTFTYSQVRTSLTYFYAKRRVCDDGVSTMSIRC